MTVKTCVTCIFKSGSQCTRQWNIAPHIDPVTGIKESGSHYMCATQRGHEHNSCGPRGKWHRPIIPTNKYPETKGEMNTEQENQDGWWVRTIKRIMS